VAKASSSEAIVVSDVLQRYAEGQKILLREAQAVTGAAIGIRNEFMNDVFQAMQDPRSLDAGGFKCMLILSRLLFTHGLISPKDMRSFIEGIVMVLVRHGIISLEEMQSFIESVGMQ
jgi:hypothetical protein